MRNSLLVILAVFSTIARGEESLSTASNLTLIPRITLMTLNSFALPNENFDMGGEPSPGIPFIELLVAKHFVEWGALDFAVQAGAGYGYRQQAIARATPSGSTTDDVSLHLFPLHLSLKTEYAISHVPEVRPGLEVGGGVYAITQAASAQHLGEAFWLPYVQISPSLTFFEANYGKGDWWGGFCFGVTYQTTVAGRGLLQAWSFDLSTNILL